MAYTAGYIPVAQAAVITIQGSAAQVTEGYRFYLVLNGELELVRQSTRHFLVKQDILLLFAGEEYRLSASGSNLVLMVELHSDFFEQGLSEQYGRYVCDSAGDTERDYAPVRHLLAQIAMLYFEKNDVNSLHLYELSYALLFYLNRYHYLPLPDENRGKDIHTKRKAKILEYIERNYQQLLTLEDLSREMHLAETYLSKYIRQNLGVNFYAHLNSVRLRHAISELKTTDQSVTSIALNNGFSSSAAFIKIFKDTYGITPGKFRRDIPETADEDNNSIILMDYSALQENLDSFDELAGLDAHEPLSYPNRKEINIVDITRYKSTTQLWRTMINVGFTKNVSDSNLRAQLALAQKSIGFQFCRLQGVFGDVLPRLPNSSEFNFSEFDRFIEYLLSLGLVPFLDLTYRKHHVILSSHDYVYTTANTDTAPVPEEQFLSDVSSLMRHCINTFGDDQVETWGFEIGYDHDVWLNLLESPSAFAHRFIKACNLIHALVPAATAGGISHNTSLPPVVFQSILSALNRDNFTPDFISLTIFPYESDKEIFNPPPVVSSDPHFASKRVDELRAIMSQYKGLTSRLFVTAFGADIYSRNYTNDTCHQAAFLVKNTVDLLGKIEALGYWQLSDIEARYSDTERILFGGTGFISVDGIKKPGFSALELLAKISPHVVKQGDSYLLTTNTRNVLHLLLYNYAHFNDVYCVGPGSRITLDEAYSVFRSPETKDFSITLSGLVTGNYKVMSTTLSREHGSLLDAWIKYGILDNLQPSELQYFRDTVHPHRLARYMQCQDGTLGLRVQLLPHEVKFLTIIREL